MRFIGFLIFLGSGFLTWRALQLTSTYQGVLAFVPAALYGVIAICGLFLLFHVGEGSKKKTLKMAHPRRH